MRNLAIRLVLWLCARYDIVPLDETRIQMNDDAKLKSHRWEGFYRESGGLSDMLDSVQADYYAAMGKLNPGDTKAMEALAIGARVTEQLRSEVRGVIAAGSLEQSKKDAVQSLAARPARKSI